MVVVTGPPGAGKSRLARDLSASTGLAYLDRDELKDALFDRLGYSDRAWSALVGTASWDLLSLVMDRLIRGRVAFIAESNFRPGEPTVSRMVAAARDTGVVVATLFLTADDDVLWERFDRRRADGGRHAGHVGFATREEFLTDLARRPHDPIDFGGPQLRIDTTERWPDVASIERWLQSMARGGR